MSAQKCLVARKLQTLNREKEVAPLGDLFASGDTGKNSVFNIFHKTNISATQLYHLAPLLGVPANTNPSADPPSLTTVPDDQSPTASNLSPPLN